MPPSPPPSWRNIKVTLGLLCSMLAGGAAAHAYFDSQAEHRARLVDAQIEKALRLHNVTETSHTDWRKYVATKQDIELLRRDIKDLRRDLGLRHAR